MSAARQDHASNPVHWEQLAAGFALDALEPDEQDEFETHLADCDLCRALVDDHALVASDLAALAGSDAADAPSWQAMRGRVLGTAQIDEPPVVVLHHRRNRRTLLTAAAASIAVIAGVAVTLSRQSGATRDTALASVAACQQTTGCRIVTLHAPDGSQRADVLVHANSVSVVPVALSSTPPGRTWVLWQVPRDGQPRLLGEFANITGGHAVRAGTLTVSYDATAEFALSDEPTSGTPTQPTQIVASGPTA